MTEIPLIYGNSYYQAYEDRYQRAHAAGADYWGHNPGDNGLITALSAWVEQNALRGRHVVEFACGEGASGAILSDLGCIWHGVDLSPKALARARENIGNRKGVSLALHDMVAEPLTQSFDAALDVMGLHMLVTDAHRRRYLSNALAGLKSGAPMLFFREMYDADAYTGEVHSIMQWQEISGLDFTATRRRSIIRDNEVHEFELPLLPARSRSREGYCAEMRAAGFVVDAFEELPFNEQSPESAAIYVHKPREGSCIR